MDWETTGEHSGISHSMSMAGFEPSEELGTVDDIDVLIGEHDYGAVPDTLPFLRAHAPCIDVECLDIISSPIVLGTDRWPLLAGDFIE
jgi:hypothetical protein